MKNLKQVSSSDSFKKEIISYTSEPETNYSLFSQLFYLMDLLFCLFYIRLGYFNTLILTLHQYPLIHLFFIYIDRNCSTLYLIKHQTFNKIDLSSYILNASSV